MTGFTRVNKNLDKELCNTSLCMKKYVMKKFITAVVVHATAKDSIVRTKVAAITNPVIVIHVFARPVQNR